MDWRLDSLRASCTARVWAWAICLSMSLRTCNTDKAMELHTLLDGAAHYCWSQLHTTVLLVPVALIPYSLIQFGPSWLTPFSSTSTIREGGRGGGGGGGGGGHVPRPLVQPPVYSTTIINIRYIAIVTIQYQHLQYIVIYC